ncbi:MAG TPA: 50S ribosomal protein P1 [Candidatus Nanoarchaeia archaeon]|nr:50S ribosomal protein P1 [Candidatus Nanoarchaeia archaeon]
MEQIYAALLLHKAGKPISEESVETVLKSAGVTADKAMIKATVSALKEVDIDKTLKEALAMPVAAAPAAAAAEKKDEKKAVEEEKKTEEEAAAGLGALFG